MAKRVRLVSRTVLLARLAESIEAARSIRQSAQLVPGREVQNGITGKWSRTNDWEKLDAHRFVEWRTKCAGLLSQLIPRRHVFGGLAKEMAVLPCSTGHLDSAIATLCGVSADFSASSVLDSASKSKKGGSNVRTRKDYAEGDEQEEDEQPVVGIAMPMGTPESDEVFDAICDECERAGFEPLRVDLIAGSARITDKFKSIVDQASVMVVDLSGLRGAVLRETGYVEAMHDEDFTILIARKDTDLPSGIAERSVLLYKSTEDLRAKIRPELEALIESLDDEEDDDDDRN